MKRVEGQVMQRFRATVLAIATWLALCSPLAAQVERAVVTGSVLDASGKPQPGVPVTATHVLLEVATEGQTDANGNFRIPDLRPGPYSIFAGAEGQGAAVEVTLTAGETRTVQLRLAAGVKPPASPVAAEPAEPEAPPPPPAKTPDFVAIPDRWRLELPAWQRYPRENEGEFPYVTGRAIDPYNQNTLKGDRPVFGQNTFFVLTGVSETVFEYRRVPTPGGVSTFRPQTEGFFGEGEQYAVLPTGVLSAEIFKGDTAFRPRDWAVRATGVFNLNYVSTQEYNILTPNPEDGRTRRRQDFALQEAFAEVKLFDVGANYDFVSVRAGIQPFNSDFRGFLFRDTNLGLRLFGTFGRNRNQWNVAVFDQLEKETNSELNLLELRKQRVLIANFFRQDFLTRGYTISPSFHLNLDEGEEEFYDANGFLVRPSPIGLIEPHKVEALYAGFGGDGHWGRLNITHQFYQAFGRDDFNGISGREVDINAQFAVVEVSVDKNWWRPKATFVYASGDDDPDDETAKGFDAIFDNPNIIGGPISFWNRQGIRLTQTFVGLVGRNSVLPSLRSSKSEGQPSFVNPGVMIVNGGVDAEWTRKLRMSVNVNYVMLHKTEVLERVLFQPNLERAVGIDGSVGFQYRPALNDNVIFQAGVSAFKPAEGFTRILTDQLLFTPFAALTLTY
jgi:hypothetical protein